jgi:hypothetical protein
MPADPKLTPDRVQWLLAMIAGGARCGRLGAWCACGVGR